VGAIANSQERIANSRERIANSQERIANSCERIANSCERLANSTGGPRSDAKQDLPCVCRNPDPLKSEKISEGLEDSTNKQCRMLNTQEASERLRLRPYTVRKMCGEGTIRGKKLRGDTGPWLIPESEIDRLTANSDGNSSPDGD
jgi:hypothetical protein